MVACRDSSAVIGMFAVMQVGCSDWEDAGFILEGSFV